MVDVQIIYKKLYQRELVTSDWFFVIRNNSGVQIFCNDEKARQRHLPKMYTLVVTMNWNRFRKIFRIRFCIFYNRSELSHWLMLLELVWLQEIVQYETSQFIDSTCTYMHGWFIYGSQFVTLSGDQNEVF